MWAIEAPLCVRANYFRRYIPASTVRAQVMTPRSTLENRTRWASVFNVARMTDRRVMAIKPMAITATMHIGPLHVFHHEVDKHTIGQD
jgi:hypothetical protein